MKVKWFSSFLIVVMLVIAIAPAAAAAPLASSGGDQDPTFVQKEDNRLDPFTTQQLELKEQALEAKLNGKGYGKTGEVARGQYVQMAREGQGMVWTVLGEFADLQHNLIPEPNRAVDNSTYWVSDFNKAHYDEMLYSQKPGVNSMANFYIELSSNRWTIAGEATDWIPVPGAAATYNDDLDSPLGGNAVWYFLNDSVDGWYESQLAAGKTPAEINGYLATFDVWDRYDADGDGNFDEPDGYIDTFQSVHAGEGEEAGAPFEAIWSHSWYAFYAGNGPDGTGPDDNGWGGVRIGNSNFWVGKYTVQPENGGVGVFAHEYGHDLGLPDLYDTAGGDNGTGFWTLMSSGSWLGTGQDSIGTKPGHMGAWEKFQLGWLNYQVAFAGKASTFKLGPMEFNTKQAQGLFVVLPKKSVTTVIGTPYAGSQFYYSGSGDDLDNSMTKSVSLPAAPVNFTAKVRYSIELDWDYAYLTVNGTPVATNLSVTTNPNGQNFGYGITGSSSGNWVDLTADLSAFAGQTVTLGFRYWTDANTGGYGFMVDNISINGDGPDGAETDAGWTFDGFRTSTGTESALFNHYYVAEYRTYKGYDNVLKTGPYQFGYTGDMANYVDHFPYQDGLLINYWDTSQRNNNTIQHPGQGLVLPIDAHFAALYRVDGKLWRQRIQTYDATFTLDATDGIPNIHVANVLSPVPSLKAAPVFDDRTLYWDPANPLNSVKNPNTGTQIRIVGISALGGFMQVEVKPAK